MSTLHSDMVSDETLRLVGVIADKIEDGTLFSSGMYRRVELAEFVRRVLSLAKAYKLQVQSGEDGDGLPDGYATWYNQRFYGQPVNTARDHDCEAAWRSAIGFRHQKSDEQGLQERRDAYWDGSSPEYFEFEILPRALAKFCDIPDAKKDQCKKLFDMLPAEITKKGFAWSFKNERVVEAVYIFVRNNSESIRQALR